LDVAKLDYSQIKSESYKVQEIISIMEIAIKKRLLNYLMILVSLILQFSCSSENNQSENSNW